MKKKLLVSFSGGETSAYMAKWLWDHKQDEYEMIFVFANTAQENEETLQFVRNCEIKFGLNIIWVETIPRVSLLGKIVEMCISVFIKNWVGGRISSTFKIVNYNTASRNGEPFEKVIQKYGIPNMSTPHCTRELKQSPIKAYAKSLGWKKYYTAIGIREDEIDRMSAKMKVNRLVYPLISMRPMTKPKINFWWQQQSFRLNLKGYQGNCITCWKKSDNKLYQIAKENPFAFNFFGNMELRYGKYIPESRLKLMNARGELPVMPITFFRKNRSAIDIINESKSFSKDINDDSMEFDEQCEVFSQCGVDN